MDHAVSRGPDIPSLKSAGRGEAVDMFEGIVAENMSNMVMTETCTHKVRKPQTG